MDKLMGMYKDWIPKAKANNVEVNDDLSFPAFQGGVTSGAVSMRDRALAEVRSILGKVPNQNELTNRLLTAIGQLGDIPQ